MELRDLDYELPSELIAQEPTSARDGARLLVVGPGRGALEHRRIVDLPELLPPSLLVVNDTRVIPARLRGTKATGGKVELLLVERIGPAGARERWRAMGRASKGLRAGTRITLGDALEVEVESKDDEGMVIIALTATSGDVASALECVGETPLPPYIQRVAHSDDVARYQTVYAARPGAVAAPTAGLHLSESLLAALAERGHRLATITLHVGPGTFRPIDEGGLDAHRMHVERYDVPEAAARAIAAAKAEGRPVVAVGTTVVRTLESAVGRDGAIAVGEGETRLFIRPPYAFRAVDMLLTNFHLPCSTLLALVMAFAGIETTKRAYEEAIRERYRFFSYGDAMLIRGRP